MQLEEEEEAAVLLLLLATLALLHRWARPRRCRLSLLQPTEQLLAAAHRTAMGTAMAMAMGMGMSIQGLVLGQWPLAQATQRAVTLPHLTSLPQAIQRAAAALVLA